MSAPDAPSGPPARDAWRAAVDPRLVDACERHARRADRLLYTRPATTFVRAPRVHVEPEDWGAGFLAVREREIPYQLQTDLKQLMPQALLRDLYRPVRTDVWVDREVADGTAAPSLGTLLDQTRQARTRPPLPRVEPSLRAVREHQAYQRALVRERWQPALRDDEPRRPVPGV